MPTKKNPLNLNALQLKTLAVLQHLSRSDGHHGPANEDGSIPVGNFPAAHGDHFHVGDAVVLARDMTGLGNKSVFAALERKGLIRSRFPFGAELTSVGLGYETGLETSLIHRSGH